MNRFSDIYSKMEHLEAVKRLSMRLEDAIEMLEELLPNHTPVIKPIVMFEKSKDELLKDLSDLQLQQRTIIDFLNSLD